MCVVFRIAVLVDAPLSNDVLPHFFGPSWDGDFSGSAAGFLSLKK
jgi:hypothetical protein